MEEEEGVDEDDNDKEEEELYSYHSGEISIIEENWASVLEDLSHFCVQWLKRLMIQSPCGLTTEQQPSKRIAPLLLSESRPFHLRCVAGRPLHINYCDATCRRQFPTCANSPPTADSHNEPSGETKAAQFLRYHTHSNTRMQINGLKASFFFCLYSLIFLVAL